MRLEVGVEVEVIALRVLELGPSWIEGSTERSAVVCLLVARCEADRMLVFDAVLEKLLEPVGIATLSFTKVLATIHIGILDRVLTISVIIHMIIHIAVDPPVSSGSDVVGDHTLPLVHFLEDGHLILRIEDVVVAVGRDGSIGQLRLVGEAIDPLVSTTRLDGDDPTKSTLSIESRSRRIGDDTEALDILLRKPWKRCSDDALSIGGVQVRDVEVLILLVDDTIDDPQRVIGTLDRGRLTHRGDRRGFLLLGLSYRERHLHRLV